jgi:serine phosphatase RsbU (regulator of sigma subunit)
MPKIKSNRPTDFAESRLHPVEWSRFDGVDLHAGHHAECCGGDFFDGLAIGDHLLFLLTDIAGPRLEAQGVALQVQNAFRQRARELFAGSEVNESDATAALVHAVNLALIEAAQRVRLAPTFLGCFNLPLGILTYCNAGNLLALLRDGDNVQVLESGGMPLGLFTHSTFEAVILALQEGDTLLMVTKGVIESRRGAVEFGIERVEQLLRKSIASSAAEICDTVLREAYDHANDPWSRILGLLHGRDRRRRDDLTALALVRRQPKSA